MTNGKQQIMLPLDSYIPPISHAYHCHSFQPKSPEMEKHILSNQHEGFLRGAQGSKTIGRLFTPVKQT